MHASGWNSGKIDEPGAYGIKFTPADRDRHFERSWMEIVLDLQGGPTTTISLTDSFWRNCSELRSADIGRWLMASGHAPWAKQNPPSIAVRQVDGNRFAARVLEHKTLL